MECSRVNKLFSEYLDGTLEERTRRMLEEHLAACGGCAEDLRTLRSCVAALGSLDKVKAPADFLEKVHARIELDERASWLGRFKEKLFFPLHVKVPLEMAGLAVAVLLVVFLYHGTKQRVGPGCAPQRAEAPTAEEADQKPETRSLDQFALKDAPPPKLSEAATGAVVPSPAPAPATAEKTKPLQLALLLGEAKGSLAASAERDDQAERGEQPGEALERESTLKSRQEESSLPLPTQKARPAAPSVAGRSSIPSRMKGARVSPGKDAADDVRSGLEGKSARSAARTSRSMPPTGGSKSPDAPMSREPMAPREALAEIRGLVESAGGTIESIQYNAVGSRPESLMARIPAQFFPRFLDQLQRIGQLRDPAEARDQIPGTETILVQITLELAR
jgi:hypothetical protein